MWIKITCKGNMNPMNKIRVVVFQVDKVLMNKVRNKMKQNESWTGNYKLRQKLQ